MTEQKNQPEAAGFLNPFKWGKKKDKEATKAEKAQANPPVVQSEPTPTPPPAAPEPTPVPAARTHTVRSGDTLWDLAVEYYGDGRKYTKIAQANNIPNPNLINIGMELTIPD